MNRSETDGSINLVETGQPNLRTTIPLDFDQRQASLQLIIDMDQEKTTMDQYGLVPRFLKIVELI